MKTLFTLLLSSICFLYAFSQELTLKNNGRVGIGTTEPSTKLQVEGGDISTSLYYRSINPNSSGFSQLGFFNDNLTLFNFDASKIEFWTGTSPGAAFQRMVVANNGNVGVGIDEPLLKLHVDGPVGFRDFLRFHTANPAEYFTAGFSGDQFQFLNFKNTDIEFYTSPTGNFTGPRLSIESEGNIGIHTDDPQDKLHIKDGYVRLSPEYGVKLEGANTSYTSSIKVNGTGLQVRNSIPSGPMLFYTSPEAGASNLRLRISADGKIGMGGYSGQHHLEVGYGGNVFFGDGGSNNRRGLSINGITGSGETSFSALSAFDYGSSSGINLALNPLGGNVGIGTTSPNENLSVISNDPRMFIGTASSEGRGLLIDGVSGNSARIEAYDYASAQGTALALNSFGGGRVGVGTTAPQSKLHIANGSVRIENTHRLDFEDTGGDPFGSVYMDNFNNFRLDSYAGNNIILSTSSQSASAALGRVYVKSDGDVGIATSSPTAKLSVNGSANKPGGGTWATFSDRRSKYNIQKYTLGLAQLVLINPVKFTYKPEFGWGDDEHVGLIAQEVKEVLPAIVNEIEVNGITDFNEVDPNDLTYLLINSVKELKAENDELRKRLEKIEALLEQ